MARGSINRRCHRHVSLETILGFAANRRLQTYRDITECVKPRMPAGQDEALHLDQPELNGISLALSDPRACEKFPVFMDSRNPRKTSGFSLNNRRASDAFVNN